MFMTYFVEIFTNDFFFKLVNFNFKEIVILKLYVMFSQNVYKKKEIP